MILLVTEEHFKAYRRVKDRVHGVVARHATVQSLERYRDPLFPPSKDEIVEPPNVFQFLRGGEDARPARLRASRRRCPTACDSASAASSRRFRSVPLRSLGNARDFLPSCGRCARRLQCRQCHSADKPRPRGAGRPDPLCPADRSSDATTVFKPKRGHASWPYQVGGRRFLRRHSAGCFPRTPR